MHGPYSDHLLIALLQFVNSDKQEMGSFIAAHLELAPMFGLRTKDFGELGASAVARPLLQFRAGADLVHSASSFMRKPLGIVEDGGELLVISMICWRIYGTYTQTKSRRIADPGPNWKSFDTRTLAPRDRETDGAPIGP